MQKNSSSSLILLIHTYPYGFKHSNIQTTRSIIIKLYYEFVSNRIGIIYKDKKHRTT